MHSDRVSHLIFQLQAPAPDLRLRAAQALGELGDRRAVPALVDRLADEDPAVGEAASQALLNLRGREVAVRLAPLLSVEQVGLRNAAMHLLRRLGEDAPDMLLDLLGENDRDLRIFAADILANVDAPGVARALTKALEDPDPNVRANAATSLGQRGEASALPNLIQLLGDEEWVAFAVIEALAHIGEPAAVEPLIACLRDGSEILRVAVAEALGRFRDPKALPPVLEAMRRSEGPLLQHLLSALLKSANPTMLKGMDKQLRERACLGLIDALNDPSEQVVADALLGLAVLGDGSSVYSILDLARKEPNEQILELIVLALGSIGELAPLVGAVDDPSPRLAEAAVRALGQIGGEAAVDPLIKALRHPAKAVRHLATRNLGVVGSRRALAALLVALGDSDDDIKIHAAWALGRLGDAGTVPTLGVLLGHQKEPVRYQALEALLAINGQAVRKVFIDGLDSRSPFRREMCAKGLGRMGAGEGMGAVAHLFNDSYPSVRREAALALLASGDRRSMTFLEMVVHDPDAAVRQALVKALAQSRPAGGLRLLVKALQDPDPAIRLKAVEGLGRAGANEAVEPLLELLDNKDSRLKVSAAKALGAIGDPRASTPLIELLADANPTVRAAAAAAIQKIEGGW
ncbi:hypothetical protein AAU61_06725 [Desulfocarbo indianensis]|nr:hypothetical protein AAU61_06725 [Desulfocarbo indianensis]